MEGLGMNNKLQREAEHLRWVAFCGATMSTVATLLCAISVPLLYSYLQHIQSMMGNEVEFCRSRSNNIWREIFHTQVLFYYLLIILKMSCNQVNITISIS